MYILTVCRQLMMKLVWTYLWVYQAVLRACNQHKDVNLHKVGHLGNIQLSNCYCVILDAKKWCMQKWYWTRRSLYLVSVPISVAYHYEGLSGVSPTPISPTLDQKVAFHLLIKTALCNVLNINELLNIQHNNTTTLLQYLDISVCRYSLYIFL